MLPSSPFSPLAVSVHPVVLVGVGERDALALAVVAADGRGRAHHGVRLQALALDQGHGGQGQQEERLRQGIEGGKKKGLSEVFSCFRFANKIENRVIEVTILPMRREAV